MEENIIVAVFVLVVLAGVGFLIWTQRGTIQLLFTLLAQGWRSRRDFNPLTRPGRWRLLGLFLIFVGGAAILQARLLFVDVLDSFAERILLFIAGFGPIIAGLRCFGYARRFDVKKGAGVLAGDTRPPVLYLRSFEDDAEVAGKYDLALGPEGIEFRTEEEEFAEMVANIGPLVAIGRPGEELSYAGAARLYVGTDDWHERVRRLYREAKLVIIRAGDTPGLLWEVEEAAKSVKPNRLVILLPFDRKQYETFRQEAERHLPCKLPEYEGGQLPITSLRAVLYFDADWTPHVVALQETFSEALRIEAEGGTDIAGLSKLRRVLVKTLGPVLLREFGE